MDPKNQPTHRGVSSAASSAAVGGIVGRGRNIASETVIAQAELNQQLMSRSIKHSKPQVIVLDNLPSGVPLAREGTVICLIANRGSELLDDIAKAAKQRDFKALKRYSDIIFGQMSSVLFGRTRLFKSIADIPVLTEFRYAGRTLAQGVFVSDRLEVASAAVLYSGGHLDESKFQVVDYTKAGSKTTHDSLVLVNTPHLSDLEKAILQKVPSEQSEVFVSAANAAYPAVIARVAWQAAKVVTPVVLEKIVEKAVDYVWNYAADAAVVDDADAQFVYRVPEADFYNDNYLGVGDQAAGEGDRAAGAGVEEQAAGAGAGAGDQAADNNAAGDQAGDQAAGAGDDAAENDADAGAGDQAHADGGISFQSLYDSQLERISFANLDATASAQALLALRSRLLTRGRG